MNRRPLFPTSLSAVAIFLLGGAAAGAASTDGGSLGFWDKCAVVVARAEQAPNQPEGETNLQVLKVLTTSSPMPALLTGEEGRIANVAPGDVVLLYLFKDPIKWHCPYANFHGGEMFAFMPPADGDGVFGNGAVHLSGLDDKRIAETEQKIRESQAKAQPQRLAAAKAAMEQRFATQVGEYEDFWKIHALVVVHMVPVGVAKGVQADLKAVLFAPYVSPPLQGAVAFDWRTPALEIGGTQGEWAVLLLANSEIGWMISSVPQPFMPGDIGIVELKDEKDPRIDQIQKGAQGWFQQILDNGGAKLSAPLTVSSSSAPAVAPAAAR